jgi:hypothetical protein
MDELDKFLKSIDLNLDADDEDDRGGLELGNNSSTSVGGAPGHRRESALEREKRTESILRHDLVAPHVVHFSPSYYNSRKRIRLALTGFLVLALSITGVIHISKSVFSLAHEDTLDIESSMEAVSVDLNTTTDSTSNLRNNTGGKS